MGHFADLSGRIYTRLRVIRQHGWRGEFGSRTSLWECLCDPDHGGCGKTTVVPAGKLNTGHTASCGCLAQDTKGKASITHGASRGKTATNKVTLEYSSWESMRRRCMNPTDRKYPRYGGRGITICERWRKDFAAFLADMGPRPSPAHSIDRIDNNGNYEPGNCRWATAKSQQRNRANNAIITHEGVSMCISEWSERIGVKSGTLLRRISSGWPVHLALATPVSPRNTNIGLKRAR